MQKTMLNDFLIIDYQRDRNEIKKVKELVEITIINKKGQTKIKKYFLQKSLV